MSEQMSENTISLQESFENLNNAPKGRFANVKRDYTLDDVKKLSGSVTVEHSLARHTAEKNVGIAPQRRLRQHTWRYDRQPSHAANQSRIKSNLPVRLASGSGCQFCWRDVS